MPLGLAVIGFMHFVSIYQDKKRAPGASGYALAWRAGVGLAPFGIE